MISNPYAGHVKARGPVKGQTKGLIVGILIVLEGDNITATV